MLNPPIVMLNEVKHLHQKRAHMNGTPESFHAGAVIVSSPGVP